MYSPLLYTLASIIPGLGFLLLGLHKKALGVFLVVLIPVSVYFIVDREPYKSESIFIIIFAWIGQMIITYMSVKTLRPFLNDRQTKRLGEMELTIPALESTFRQWLNESNIVLKVVVMVVYFIQRKPGIAVQFPAGIRYLGVSKDEGIIIDLDYLGKPHRVKRYPLEKIESIRVRRGLVTDNVTLNVGEESFRLNVSIYLREQTKILANLKIEKQDGG